MECTENSSEKSNLKAFPYNTPLQKLEFENIKEYKDYTYKNKDIADSFYGKIGAEYQYIEKHYDKKTSENCRTWFMDIETNVEDEFPCPVKVEQPITFIQVYDSISDEIYIWHWQKDVAHKLDDDVIDYKFDNEHEMLDHWLQQYYDSKPAMVTGWNFVSFDLRYITNRLDRLGYEEDVLSPFSKSVEKKYEAVDGDIKVRYPVGVTWIDYADIFKSHAYIKVSDMKLDTVAQTVLKTDEGKLNWKDYFKSFRDMAHFKYTPPDILTEEMKEEEIYKTWLELQEEQTEQEERRLQRKLIDLSHSKFYEYSVLDARLLKNIDAKIQLASLAYGYAWGMGINLLDITGTIKPWTCLLYGHLQEYGYMIPANIPEHEKYRVCGGYWASNPGMYEWILSQDFTSLYPLNAVSLNMSPETIIHIDDIPKDLAKYLAPVTRHWGILPKKKSEKKSDPDVEGWIDREDSQSIYMNFSDDYKEKIRDLAKKYNFSVCTNGTCFSNDFEGILPKEIMKIFNKRVEYKGIMKKHEKEAERLKGAISKYSGDSTGLKELNNQLNYAETQAGIFNILQQVEKIKINSLYGALSNAHFPIGVSDIASAITAYGRFSLLMLEQTGNEVMQKMVGKDAIVSNHATDACVDGSTIINTSAGDMRLDELYNNSEHLVKTGSGDFKVYEVDKLKVKSYDTKKSNIEMKDIIYVSRRKSKQKRYKIKYKDRTIILTEEHEVYVRDTNNVEFWCKAKHLKKEYTIISSVA